MPIVTVELVAEPPNAPERNLAQLLADALGGAFASPPGQTWVRVRWLARHDYAENEIQVDADQLPVFVTVLKQHLPSAAELHAEVAAVTAAIAQVVGRDPASVHVEYAPAAAGRVSFGGKIVQGATRPNDTERRHGKLIGAAT